MRIEEFEASLEAVPWFGSIGVAADGPGSRMVAWEEWPGPESPLVEPIHLRQQGLHDEIVETGAESLEMVFERVRQRVLTLAASRVPYDPAEDAWHPPSTAVWHAAWTAGLMALCIVTERTPPDDLRSQWEWFSRGHWPAAYSSDSEGAFTSEYLIF